MFSSCSFAQSHYIYNFPNLVNIYDSPFINLLKYYDYINLYLLKLLFFSAKELSDVGRLSNHSVNDPITLKKYGDTLDNRTYQLNVASEKLTNEIKNIWDPNPNRL